MSSDSMNNIHNMNNVSYDPYTNIGVNANLEGNQPNMYQMNDQMNDQYMAPQPTNSALPGLDQIPELSNNSYEEEQNTNKRRKRSNKTTDNDVEMTSIGGTIQNQSMDNSSKQRKWISKDIVKDKEGNVYYYYTYMVKQKNGMERPQKVYIKKNSKSNKKPKTEPKPIKQHDSYQPNEGNNQSLAYKLENPMQMEFNPSKNTDAAPENKERKKTKELLKYIQDNYDQIRSYSKFVVTRVLQDFKRDNPDSKVSYGLVKKVLDSQGFLDEQKNKNY